MKPTQLTPEERKLREDYVDNKCKLYQRADKARSAYTMAYLAMKNAHQELMQIENEMWTLVCEHVKNTEDMHTPSQEWHPASDQPETKDGWFLAVTKDNQPFLTHYINGWVSQVYQWTYIFLPRNT